MLRSAKSIVSVEQRTQEIGRELLAATRAAEASGLSAKFWHDRLIAGSLQNERFKTELFRFVDVFPVLRTPEQVHRHLIEYLQQPGVVLPSRGRWRARSLGKWKTWRAPSSQGQHSRKPCQSLKRDGGRELRSRSISWARRASPTLKRRRMRADISNSLRTCRRWSHAGRARRSWNAITSGPCRASWGEFLPLQAPRTGISRMNRYGISPIPQQGKPSARRSCPRTSVLSRTMGPRRRPITGRPCRRRAWAGPRDWRPPADNDSVPVAGGRWRR